MKALPTALAIGLAAIAGSAFAADPDLGRNLAATCANCHGTGGKAAAGTGIESLAGMEKGMLVQKLKDFKAGAIPASIMQQIAKGYSDEQIDLIATWFAARK